MAKIPTQKRMTQLALFAESPDAPHWRDLAEATRLEAIRLVAQLLLSIRPGKLSRAPQTRGGRDE